MIDDIVKQLKEEDYEDVSGEISEPTDLGIDLDPLEEPDG